MTVKRILEEKGRDVLTTGPHSTLRDAATLMQEHHVGAVIIVDFEEHIGGILAERDIVAAIAKHGAECLDKPVSSLMWRRVYTCREDMSVEEVMEMMSKHRARHLPVEKNGRLTGIISIGDVVKAHIRDIRSEADHIKAYIAS